MIIPEYPSNLLPKKIFKLTGRTPLILKKGEIYRIGDISCKIWMENSPMNQDCSFVLTHNNYSIVHTVDSRLNSAQFEEILDYLKSPPNLLLIQCSGASWYPYVYENYSKEVLLEKGFKKRMQKVEYACDVCNILKPDISIICAGPPVFLDNQLLDANNDKSFLNPLLAKNLMIEKGYNKRIECPLPGDLLSLKTGNLRINKKIHDVFNWSNYQEYINDYSQRMQHIIKSKYIESDSIVLEDVDKEVIEFFEGFLSLNNYFIEKSNISVLFDIYGPDGGKWIVEFKKNGRVKKWHKRI